MPARHIPWLVAAVLALSAVGAPSRADARRPGGRSIPTTVLLNGERTEVRWSDGDSFRVLSGRHQGRGTRLEGYNTLEAYGPVHRWGDWTPAELYALARSSAGVAGSREWRCTTTGEVDHYRRLLVDCPDAAEELIRRGHAMAYSIDGPSDARLQAAQEDARRSGAGMWAKGTPRQVVASLHSVEEAGLEGGAAYDRVVDARTGEARPQRHDERYRVCEEVCRGEGADRSCMTYVPFEIRYRKRPECLRGTAPRRGRRPPPQASRCGIRPP